MDPIARRHRVQVRISNLDLWWFGSLICIVDSRSLILDLWFRITDSDLWFGSILMIFFFLSLFYCWYFFKQTQRSPQRFCNLFFIFIFSLFFIFLDFWIPTRFSSYFLFQGHEKKGETSIYVHEITLKQQ